MKRTPAMLFVLAGLMFAAPVAFGQESPAPKKETVPATEIKQPPKMEEKGDEKPAAKAATLHVGDKAPALSLGETVKGDAVTGFEKGKIYVVEFWATWCPPCRESVPHLSKLQAEFKDKGVVILGISDETTAKVKPFVEKMGDKMAYVVAMDDARKTNKAWMEAAKQDGIPTAFIVDRAGMIAWIGHPMEMDAALKPIVEGKYDVKAAAANKAAKEAAMTAIQEAYEAGEWDKVIAGMDGLIKADPTMAPQIERAKFQILLTQKKDYKAAYAQATKLADGTMKDDAKGLNEIAWTILDAEGVEKRDLDLAMKIAVRAVEVSKHKDGMIMDTLARAHWEKGDKVKAIETQKKAIELSAGNDELKEELTKTLEKYEAKNEKK